MTDLKQYKGRHGFVIIAPNVEQKSVEHFADLLIEHGFAYQKPEAYLTRGPNVWMAVYPEGGRFHSGAVFKFFDEQFKMAYVSECMSQGVRPVQVRIDIFQAFMDQHDLWDKS